MGKGRSIIQRLAEEAELTEVPFPGQPIVEIAGENRVLIENHLGVIAYSRETVRVKVRFGCICVSGCGLELLRMSREQLIIRGRIDGVTLQRRG